MIYDEALQEKPVARGIVRPAGKLWYQEAGRVFVREVNPENLRDEDLDFGLDMVEHDPGVPTVEGVSPFTAVRTTIHTNGVLTMVDGDWGRWVPGTEREEYLRAYYPEIFLAETTHRTGSWAMAAESRQGVIRDTLRVAKHMGIMAIEARNRTLEKAPKITPAHISGIFLGGDLPPYELSKDPQNPFQFSRRIAEGIGIPDDVQDVVVYEACNSGYRALQILAEMAKKEGFQDGYYLVLALGMGTNEVLIFGKDGSVKFNVEGVDAFSAATFHNGAASMVVEVRGGQIVGFPYIEGSYDVSEDTAGNLATVTTYRDLLFPRDQDDVHRILYRHSDGRNLMEMLRMPLFDGIVRLDGKETAKMFKDLVVSSLLRYLPDLEKRDLMPQYIVMHPASRPVCQAVFMELLRHGYAIPCSMLETKNSSAPSTLKNLAQHLKYFEDGARVLVVSFGAGGSISLGLHMNEKLM